MSRTPDWGFMRIEPAVHQREVCYNESMIIADAGCLICADSLRVGWIEPNAGGVNGMVQVSTTGVLSIYQDGWRSLLLPEGAVAWIKGGIDQDGDGDGDPGPYFYNRTRGWCKIGVDKLTDCLDFNSNLSDRGLLRWMNRDVDFVCSPQAPVEEESVGGIGGVVIPTPGGTLPTTGNHVLTRNGGSGALDTTILNSTQTTTVDDRLNLTDLLDVDASHGTGCVLVKGADGIWRNGTSFAALLPPVPVKLNDFTDCLVAATPSNGDVLTWDNGAWTNKARQVFASTLTLRDLSNAGTAPNNDTVTAPFATDGQTLAFRDGYPYWEYVPANLPDLIDPDRPLRQGAHLFRSNGYSTDPEIAANSYHATRWKFVEYDTAGFVDGDVGFIIPNKIRRVRLSYAGITQAPTVYNAETGTSTPNPVYAAPRRLIVSKDGGATWQYVAQQAYYNTRMDGVPSEPDNPATSSGYIYYIHTPFMEVQPGWRFRAPPTPLYSVQAADIYSHFELEGF